MMCKTKNHSDSASGNAGRLTKLAVLGYGGNYSTRLAGDCLFGMAIPGGEERRYFFLNPKKHFGVKRGLICTVKNPRARII
jgi:hypothetical protein